jgi:C_GCAxxG_C_C family probable redox protein
MHRVEASISSFREGFSCAEAIASVYGPRFGLDRDTSVRVAGGLGGGLAGRGGTCGAITGASLIIGLRHGRVRADDLESKSRTYELVNELLQARNGSTVCRELLGRDVSTPEGKQEARARCPRFVQDAAEILEELLGPVPTV